MSTGKFAALLEYLHRELHDEPGDLPVSGFFTALDPAEAERLSALWEATCHLVDEDFEAATRLTEGLVRTMPDEDDGHGAMVVRTFAEALLGRSRQVSSSGGNLYLGARPPGAQLRAFELLRMRTPLIPFAYAAANRALIHDLEPDSDVTLIDVGIGRGGQVRALLRNPLARTRIRRLRVVGVEPDSDPGSGQGALQLAGAQVLDAAAEVGLEVEFIPVGRRAEALAASDFPELRGHILANAAFALHHVPPAAAGGRERGDVLALLQELGAEKVVLTEPDSDHVEDRLPARLLFAYRHYRTVASSLAAMLPQADAVLVWTEFFAPEVRNVVGHEGVARTERHERSPTWAAHLRQAGWRVDTPHQLVPSAGAPPGFTLDESGSGFRLLFRGVPLLSVIRGAQG